MTRQGRVLAYLQLARIPNVFTALADVFMGFLVTRLDFLPGRDWITSEAAQLLLLSAASAALYTAGIVLNDLFDVEQDRRERPARPIPSGRVAASSAGRLGGMLLAAGIALAAMVSLMIGHAAPVLTAVGLAAAILAYDRVLKRTFLGPVGMGLCRMLNVLLGMSSSAEAWAGWNWQIAVGVGIYIAGVTWFARKEAAISKSVQLAAATATMMAGIALLATYPQRAPQEILAGMAAGDTSVWNFMWLVLAMLIGWRCLRAIITPHPGAVQQAVRQSIFSLILLDAVVAYGVRDLAGALFILPLLAPAMFLGRFIYST